MKVRNHSSVQYVITNFHKRGTWLSTLQLFMSVKNILVYHLRWQSVQAYSIRLSTLYHYITLAHEEHKPFECSICDYMAQLIASLHDGKNHLCVPFVNINIQIHKWKSTEHIALIIRGKRPFVTTFVQKNKKKNSITYLISSWWQENINISLQLQFSIKR